MLLAIFGFTTQNTLLDPRVINALIAKTEILGVKISDSKWKSSCVYCRVNTVEALEKLKKHKTFYFCKYLKKKIFAQNEGKPRSESQPEVLNLLNPAEFTRCFLSNTKAE